MGRATTTADQLTNRCARTHLSAAKPARLSHPNTPPHLYGDERSLPLQKQGGGGTGGWVRGSPVGPILTRSMRPSRQELGAAGECSGIRRMGGCCGAPYSLWLLGHAGLLRMGGHCRWEKPGSCTYSQCFSTLFLVLEKSESNYDKYEYAIHRWGSVNRV